MRKLAIITLALVAGAMFLGCQQEPAPGNPPAAPAGDGGGTGDDGGQDETPAPTEPNTPSEPTPTPPDNYIRPSFSDLLLSIDGMVGEPLSRILPAATGGEGTLRHSLQWRDRGEHYPSWASFKESSRRLSGTPVKQYAYTATYTATDARGSSASMTVALYVAAAPFVPPLIPPPPAAPAQETVDITVTIRRTGSDTLSLMEPCRRCRFPTVRECTSCLEAGTGYGRSDQVFTVSYSAKPNTRAWLTADINRSGSPCNRWGRIDLGTVGYPTTTTVTLLCRAFREEHQFDAAWDALDGASTTFKDVRVEDE